MPLLILAALTFLGAAFMGANSGPSGGPFLNQPTYTPISQVCLDDNTAKNGVESPDASIPQTLKKVKKPDFKTDFITGQGWVYPECENKPNGCTQTGDADFVLVATNVKVDPVTFPRGGTRHGPYYPSDRQLLRYNPTTIVSSDIDTQKQLKGRSFRTFCGDWCCDGRPGCELAPPDAPGPLPYLGSFHCDFLFYLQNTDEKGAPQVDDQGNIKQPNPADPNLPANGNLFSIYFRKDAKIPPKIQCTNPTATPTPLAMRKSFPFDSNAAYAGNNQTGFEWDGKEWLYKRDSTIKNYEVNPEVAPYVNAGTNSNVVTNPMTGVVGDWEVFKNLNYPSSDEILYIVRKGEYQDAINPLLTPSPTPPPVIVQPPIRAINFKEYHLLGVVKPTGRSLQLGTFFPPKAADWIKKWYEESKPAIYLYPQKDTLLSVTLNPAGHLTVSDPLYDSTTGWKDFVAHPDGTLTYKDQSYPYLYYEAALEKFPVDQTTGFVVAGKDLVSFFGKTLPVLGLNQKETEDFIDYWMGRLSIAQPYYFISFLSKEQIETIEPLTISQKPDSEIRIRAYFKPLSSPILVEAQELPIPSERKGFTLVEWGGILDQ